MELRDLIVTPIFVIFVFVLAYLIRPRVTDSVNRKYFLPALTIKIVGAILLGVIYQFYYGGGDTFNYHTHGSRHIWEALMDSPSKGIGMMFSSGIHKSEFYKYSSKIPFFGDPSSFFVVRLAAFFDVLTFSSYSATSLFFTSLSFIGSWLFFLTFYKRFPEIHQPIAFAVFFIPSVIFWGSGILKDTITLACLGMLTYGIDQLFFQKKISLINILLFTLSIWCIFSVKKFILQAFFPAALIWVYLKSLKTITSPMLKVLLIPLIFVLSIFSTYYAVVKIGEGDKRYSIDKIAFTAKETAYDIRFQTGRDAGSGYTLGELDGTIESMLRLAPQAINVTLFRPYLWEVKNPLMLMSSLESLAFLFSIFFVVIRKRKFFFEAFLQPDIAFCLIFTLIFSFAVGISTYNFGTLVRYKIPMMPFFLIGLVLIWNYPKRFKKLVVFDKTE